MTLSTVFEWLSSSPGDTILGWVVAAIAGCICVVALLNVLDIVLGSNDQH